MRLAYKVRMDLLGKLQNGLRWGRPHLDVVERIRGSHRRIDRIFCAGVALRRFVPRIAGSFGNIVQRGVMSN